MFFYLCLTLILHKKDSLNIQKKSDKLFKNLGIFSEPRHDDSYNRIKLIENIFPINSNKYIILNKH